MVRKQERERERERESVEIMCKTQRILDDESPEHKCLSNDPDKPLTMKELDEAKIYNFDFKYGQKSAEEFNDDLSAIDLSMMYSPKVNFHRKIKRRKYPKFRFAPSLGDVKENELFDSQQLHLRNAKKDFAAIQEERALNCGIPVEKVEGRHHHHKRHSRSFNGRA